MKRSIALSLLLGFLSIPALAKKWTGYVSDQNCAASSSKAAKATDWIDPHAFESCAKKCVAAGSPVVFVTENNKILKLDPDSTRKALPLLGHRVALSGNVENGLLKIDHIASLKMEAKAKPASDQEEKMHGKP